MLYLVLLLVVGSLGLLITALRTGDTMWAWTSVAVSVVAAVLLLFDWAGRRLRQDRAAAAGSSEASIDDTASADSAAGTPDDVSAARQQPQGTTPRSLAEGERPTEVVPAVGMAAQAPAAPAGGDHSTRSGAGSGGEGLPSRQHAAADTPGAEVGPGHPGHPRPGQVASAGAPGSVPVTLDPAIEPPEEDSDAADALRVADLTDEVRVLDERPRYHLAGCAWVGDRLTLPLPVHEARELGFSPCGLCRPDAFLCGRRRPSDA